MTLQKIPCCACLFISENLQYSILFVVNSDPIIKQKYKGFSGYETKRWGQDGEHGHYTSGLT